MKRRLLLNWAFTLCALVLLLANITGAAQAEPCPVGSRCVTLAWDPVVDPALAGYRVYWWDTANKLDNQYPLEVQGYKISRDNTSSLSLNGTIYTGHGGSRITLLPPTCRDNAACDAIITNVVFYINGTQANTEADYPYDLITPGEPATGNDTMPANQVHTIRAVVNLVAGGTVELTAQCMWAIQQWEGTATQTERIVLPGTQNRTWVATAYADNEMESDFSNSVCTDCGTQVRNMRVVEE